VVAPCDVFVSYASEDAALWDELATHLAILRRQRFVSTWHHRQIRAGEDRKSAVDEHLEAAQVVLLLVSADFLDSDYCYTVEMERALARHRAGEAHVIPVILRVCDWHSAPFAHLQVLPDSVRPVTSWKNRDEAWDEVARGIRGVVKRLADPRWARRRWALRRRARERRQSPPPPYPCRATAT
jgi:hypothetical protein